MSYTEKDFEQIKNILKTIRQGKFDLTGDECLAFNQMFLWILNLHNSIKESVEKSKQRKEILNGIVPESPNKDVAKPKRTKKEVI